MLNNFVNIAYLSFRLAPIIIVSFFLLQSFLNLDARGLVYLLGLVLATLFSVYTGTYLPVQVGSGAPNTKCSLITLGKDFEPLSKAPLNILVYVYTFAYLLTSLLLNPKQYQTAALVQNIPMMILFPLLILLETGWLYVHSCFELINILYSMVVGVVFGLSWAFMISALRRPELQYLKLGNNVDVCSRPSKNLYRCKPKKM